MEREYILGSRTVELLPGVTANVDCETVGISLSVTLILGDRLIALSECDVSRNFSNRILIHGEMWSIQGLRRSDDRKGLIYSVSRVESDRGETILDKDDTVD